MHATTTDLAAVVMIEERHLLVLMLNRCVLVVEVLVVSRQVVLVGGTCKEAAAILEKVGGRLVRVVAGQRVSWLVVGGLLSQRGRMVMSHLLVGIKVMLLEVVA